jgi:hypothetical protein
MKTEVDTIMSKNTDGAGITKYVSILISFLAAGGGVIALLNYFTSGIVVHISLDDNPYYELIQDKSKRTLKADIDKLSDLEPLNSSENLYPTINFDITNSTDKPLSINAIEFRFQYTKPIGQSDKQPDIIVIVFRNDAPDSRREALARQYSLEHMDGVGQIHRYRMHSPKLLDEMIAQLKTEDRIIERVFRDATGIPHREWEVTKIVNVKLDPKRLHYEYKIRQTIPPGETVTIPVSIAASESLNGVANVRLIYNGTKRREFGDMDIQLFIPEFLRTIESQP